MARKARSAKADVQAQATGKSEGQIRRFIETCGEHPFATGLFALIGLFGLVFSFLQFGIDQAQNADDAVQSKRIEAGVSRVEKAVDTMASQSAAEADDGIVPIKVNLGKLYDLTDNISFDPAHDGKSREWIWNNDPDAIVSMPFMHVTLQSTTRSKFVQAAPWIVADVMSVERLPKTLHTLFEAERGGAEEIYSFRLPLVPKTGLQIAPLVKDDMTTPRKDVEYFKLAPGEPEEFDLTFDYVPGYRYKVRLGIQYKSGEGSKIHWFTKPMNLGLVDYEHPLKTWGDDGFVPRMHPDMEFANAAETRRLSARYMQLGNSQSLFKLSDVAGK